MSMISAQCDELRDTADKLDKTSAVSTSWIHHNLTPMMRDAADTIWELRCKLAGMVDMRERARVAEAENAKLRELVAGIGHLLFTLDVDYCAACPRDGINHPCPVYTSSGGECLYKTDLRELGVEVDE